MRNTIPIDSLDDILSLVWNAPQEIILPYYDIAMASSVHGRSPGAGGWGQRGTC